MFEPYKNRKTCLSHTGKTGNLLQIFFAHMGLLENHAEKHTLRKKQNNVAMFVQQYLIKYRNIFCCRNKFCCKFFPQFLGVGHLQHFHPRAEQRFFVAF